MSGSNFPARIAALNSSPHKYANLDHHDLVAKLAGVKSLRCGQRTVGGLTTYITSANDLVRWSFFHASVVEGNFHPLMRWLEDESSTWPVAFGVVVAQPLAEWFRSVPHYRLTRQIEAGLAALYHSNTEGERHAMRCQLYGPVLDRVLEVYDRFFVADGLDLNNEHETPKQLRRDFDHFVRAHAGTEPPPAFPLFFHLDSLFLGPNDDTADYDLARREEERWFFDSNDFSLGYWLAYIRDDDWEHIVEKDDYDELVRAEGSSFLYNAWEDFYEKNKIRYPLNQAHWRDVPPDIFLAG